MKIYNKKAKFEYELEPERYEAGLSLTGGEAKAIRTVHADINQAVARISGREAWLVNANIPIAGATKYDSTRSRKLLMHTKEILEIATKIKQKRLTLVPLSLYTRGYLVKAELALGKSKRKFEKKQAIKARDIARDIASEFKTAL